MQKHYAVIEALALDEDVKEIEDTTQPAMERFEKCRVQFEELKKAFPVDDNDEPMKKTTAKKSSTKRVFISELFNHSVNQFNRQQKHQTMMTKNPQHRPRNLNREDQRKKY